MVMARSFGLRPLLFFNACAQRAAKSKSAMESEPPETARTSPRRFSRPEKSALASASRTAWSAAPTLLFSFDGLFDARRDMWIFAQCVSQRGAGGLFLPQGGERLAESQQRLRRPRRGLVFGGNREERFGGVAILLLL